MTDRVLFGTITATVVPTQKAIAATIAMMRQQNVVIPLDVTTAPVGIIPVVREVHQINTLNSDFTGTGKNLTITFLQARGVKVYKLWLKFTLPAQYARSLSDRMEYDSLPGIHCIQQLETARSNGSQIETVTPAAIVQRFRFAYGDMFNTYAMQFWGGYKDKDYAGPLQRLTGTKNAYISSTDMKQNEIFPAIHIFLPMASSLFFNEETFSFLASQYSPVEFKIIFKNTNSFLSFTQQATCNDFVSQCEVYEESLRVNEFANHFTGLAYLNTRKFKNAYFFVDVYPENQSKTYTTSQDAKIPIKPVPTTRLQCSITPKHWTSSNIFFGTTVESSASTMIGGMTNAAMTNSMNGAYTINLHTGTFVGTGTTTSGNLSIEGWTLNCMQFSVKWQRTPNRFNTVVIKSSQSPFGSFGNLYIDLSTYGSAIAGQGFSSVHQAGIFFLCASMTLVIEPYVNDGTVNTAEVPGITGEGSAKKLARGFYTFNPDPDAPARNRHAFYRVKDFEPAGTLNPREMIFDFFASLPVPSSNNMMNSLLAVDLIRLTKNQHWYYDLDAKWPITVTEVTFDNTASNVQIFNADILMLSRRAYSGYERWDMPLDISFSFESKFYPNRTSYGYADYRTLETTQYIVKIEKKTFYNDGIEFSDTFKELAQRNIELDFYSIQWSIRLLRYQMGKIETVFERERAYLNDLIRETALLPEKLLDLDAFEGEAEDGDEGGAMMADPWYEADNARSLKRSNSGGGDNYASSRPNKRAYCPDAYSSRNNLTSRASARPDDSARRRYDELISSRR
jgi:hypothetical protein